MNTRTHGFALAAFCLFLSPAAADVLENPSAQAKVDDMIAVVRQIAAGPVIVAAVSAHNSALPADQAAMTQEKWAGLNSADPFIRAFTSSPAATQLKAKRPAAASEMFLNDARGLKVAFLAKTTYWCHSGMPKHDVPMSGRTWQGKIAVDQSTGLRELQVSVPVLSDGKPIGSLVVGIDITHL